MQRKLSLCLAICVSFILVSIGTSSHGQILIALDESGSSSFDLGAAGSNQRLDFFIGAQPGVSNDGISAAAPDFVFEVPVILDPSSMIAPQGVGSDSGSGFFGDGNLLLSDPIFRNPEPANEAEASLSTGFIVNQLLNEPEPLTDDLQLWFSLALDTTGLVDGTYDITITNLSEAFGGFVIQEDGTSEDQFLESNNNLSFVISSSAVPEPGSLSLLAMGGLLTVLTRRKRTRYVTMSS